MNFAVQGYVFEQMARNYEQNIRRIDSLSYSTGIGFESPDPLAPPAYTSRGHWRPDLLIVPAHCPETAARIQPPPVE